jgi:hypothetical protein
MIMSVQHSSDHVGKNYERKMKTTHNFDRKKNIEILSREYIST